MKTRIVYKKKKNAAGKVKILKREEIAPSKKATILRQDVVDRASLVNRLNKIDANIEKFKKERKAVKEELDIYDKMIADEKDMDKEEIVLPDVENKGKNSKK